MALTRIRVRVGRGYDVLVGTGLLGALGGACRRAGLTGRPFLVTSPAIGRRYLRAAERGLRAGGYRDLVSVRVPDGETSKSLAAYGRLLRDLVRSGRRHEGRPFVVALGGGVIGDLAGFVAATYRRGTAVVQVPTTLLAAVDSAIGGKTGIDVDGVKNAAGAFHQPRLVVADLGALGTLPPRELRAALGEVVKYGVIADPRLFAFVERRATDLLAAEPAALRAAVVACARIKARVVARDERDTEGARAVLNFGHTFGHAVESASGYALRHGEAVAIGMVCANDLAVALRILDPRTAARVERLLIRLGLPLHIPSQSVAAVLGFMRHDKKFVAGRNRFVLARSLGRTRLVEGVPLRLLERVIRSRFSPC